MILAVKFAIIFLFVSPTVFAANTKKLKDQCRTGRKFLRPNPKKVSKTVRHKKKYRKTPYLERVEEIQNAICSITTKEIEATANATITRQLKGVCTSNELNLKLDKLQTKILQEIDGIKYILELNGFKVPDVPSERVNPTSDVRDFNDSTDNAKNAESAPPTPIFKSSDGSFPRMEEFLMYNETIIDSVYFYYWKIHNIHKLLTKSNMYKSSSDFNVLGHSLHLQFYPNYMDSEHFAILLKSDNAGFIKKHKFVILNQLEPGQDLVSDILYGLRNEDRMLRISERNLKVEGFIVRDTMVVKLEIFLNS